MMGPLRVPFALAILAALLGAPSIASAASNSLSGAHVSPASGTVTTVFTFSVTYDGRFPATGMTVAAGGAALPMTRIGGTPESGTWSGSGMLPVGAWAPIFTATVDHGAAAILSGPSVSVSGAGSPSATAPAPGGGGGSQPDGGQIDPTDPGTIATPLPVPAGSDPDDSPAPASAAQTPGATEAPAGAPAPAGGSGSTGGGVTPEPHDATGDGSPGGPSGGPGSAGSSGATDDPAPGAAPAGPSAEPKPTSDDWIVPAADERDEEEDGGLAGDGPPSNRFPEMVLLIALSGVAAIALIGTAVLMAGRRRSGRDGERSAEATRTEAVLHERMLRRARVRLDDDDDPIVAAIGADDAAQHRTDRSTPRSGPPEP